jgi:hypothetical protein
LQADLRGASIDLFRDKRFLRIFLVWLELGFFGSPLRWEET